MKPTIVILDRAGTFADTSFLKRVMTALLESEDQPPSTIEVLLTGEDEIRSLNSEFRGVDVATDVLSFPHGDGPSPEGRALGEVAVCIPIAAKQAATRGTSLEAEVACLAVHGGLHLLGYEDDTLEGRAEMIERMNSVVGSCGLETREDWESNYDK